MQSTAEEQEAKPHQALALIWQGHMLDLLGRREEALMRYSQAADMNLEDTWVHSQYRMRYPLSKYARERMKKPFKRIDNQIQTLH
jgi:hypothetical protein